VAAPVHTIGVIDVLLLIVSSNEWNDKCCSGVKGGFFPLKVVLVMCQKKIHNNISLSLSVGQQVKQTDTPDRQPLQRGLGGKIIIPIPFLIPLDHPPNHHQQSRGHTIQKPNPIFIERISTKPIEPHIDTNEQIICKEKHPSFREFTGETNPDDRGE
jgi:hypothetical protein